MNLLAGLGLSLKHGLKSDILFILSLNANVLIFFAHMENPYLDFVTRIEEAMRLAKQVPLGSARATGTIKPQNDAPIAMIFAPHPDDEVIIGGLALRLLREAGWRVINVAVTQGSNKARQAARWNELAACCECIGFDLLPTTPGGLNEISPKGKAENPANWAKAVTRIASLLTRHKPKAVFFPHADDWNATHIGTHLLVTEALAQQSGEFSCHVFETEFWGAMHTPNLMVELSATDLADLLAALSYHTGEVERNPYHLSLPAWMIDNVRRGGEVVGGQGGEAPAFHFATLYRLQEWKEQRLVACANKPRFLSKKNSPAALFE